jgi:beta-phosphoglucomutase family hydrolase
MTLLLDVPDPRYDAYIFDCDGTLADSMPLHLRAWRAALLEAKASFAFTWEHFMSRAGMKTHDTVVELNREFGLQMIPEQVALNQNEHYKQLSHEVQALAPVVAQARACAGVARVAVASGSHRSDVLDTLKRVGVSELFEVVVTADDVEHGKPAPDVFLLAAQGLGVAPERCLVFEDGPLGVQAARAAGMDVILIEREKLGLPLPV